MISTDNDFQGRLLTARQLRTKLGGVSNMTIWRWMHNPSLDFPPPIKLNRRNYWSESAVNDYIHKQIEKSIGA